MFSKASRKRGFFVFCHPTVVKLLQYTLKLSQALATLGGCHVVCREDQKAIGKIEPRVRTCVDRRSYEDIGYLSVYSITWV
jgi:hypothetical protein